MKMNGKPEDYQSTVDTHENMSTAIAAIPLEKY